MKKSKQNNNFEERSSTLGVELNCFESKQDRTILGRPDQASSSWTPTTSSTPSARTSTGPPTSSWSSVAPPVTPVNTDKKNIYQQIEKWNEELNSFELRSDQIIFIFNMVGFTRTSRP